VDIALFSPLSGAGTIALVIGSVLSAVAAGWLMQLRRRRGQSGGGGWAVLVAVGGTLLVAIAVSEIEGEALDVNPEFTAAQLTGVWEHDGATLTLERGGTYACVPVSGCDSIGPGGHWERKGDFEVAFHRADGTEHLERVVSFRGEFRLTDMSDIDLWTRELTFRRRAPAS
jgi:hypothetical protein